MYSVLASMGAGWHDHKAIAAAMNKAKLNASEFAALRALSSAGRIETQLVDATYFVKRWEYRVIVPPGAAE